MHHSGRVPVHAVGSPAPSWLAARACRHPAALLAAGLLTAALGATGSAQNFHTLGEFGAGVATTGDQTGLVVAILGDVNGDGNDDLLIGAPYDDDNGTDSGTVYVVSGFTQAILYEKHGSAAGDRFGSAVANIGDMDSDGIDDFVVGSPGVNFNGNDTGGLTVFSGAEGLSQYSQLGPKAGSNFGAAVAGGGDLNNDGRGDFIVGAPSWDSVNASDNQGWIGVYSGQAGNQVKMVNGTSVGARLGATVAFVGDLNSDGRVDYAAGLPTYDYVSGGPVPQIIFDGGRVDVYSGINHALLFSKLGGQGDLLGTSIARVGDTDGDGVRELIAGAPGYASNAGTAILLEGTAGTLLHQFFGNGYTPADAFGSAVAPLGDVNHDGRDDVLIGAPLYDFTPDFGGYLVAYSGATYASYGGAVGSVMGGDSLGSALSASTGDLNGDNWNDVVAGFPFNDFAGTSCGLVRSYVLLNYQPNLNFGGPGISALVMYGTPLYPGGVADLALLYSKPNAQAWLVASPVELLGPFKGGVLVPAVSPAIILPFMTDAQGRIKLANIAGGGGPLILFMQFLIQDANQPQGWQLSNAIAAEFLP